MGSIVQIVNPGATQLSLPFSATQQNMAASARSVASSLTGSASSTASATTSSNSATITSNDFLTLLVGELKNQDPTKSQDPTAYIQQLVSVNSLEQLVDINQELKGKS